MQFCIVIKQDIVESSGGFSKMSRPLLLIILLFLMVLTSQFDWNHKIIAAESQARSSALSNKQRYVLDRRESVKEKIILSQEKHIQKLKTLVQSLQEQLLLCSSGKDEFVNDITSSLTELLNDPRQKQVLE
uniref:uncharacterized protein LOC122584956 isoform X1 n=1 Tax=Erigeron canadensis TaxID=72917 RepID=UPI001CB9603E|nr:uncharacterized protein LOC122584956 isoform X1 [Erigeron canadensis]